MRSKGAVLAAFLAISAAARADIKWDSAQREIVLKSGEHSGRIVFTGRNGGSTPVVIGEVKSSCDCSVGRISREIVPPGETVELAVEITLPKGAATAEATISATMDRTPVASFKVALKPAVKLIVTPGFVVWHAGSEDKPRELIVESSADLPDTAQLIAAVTDPAFQVKCERIAGTRRWRARVSTTDISNPHLATLTFEVAGSDPPIRTNAYAKILPGGKAAGTPAPAGEK